MENKGEKERILNSLIEEIDLDNQVKKERITIRLTEVEKKVIEENAEKVGMSVGRYLVRKGLSLKTKPRLTNEEKEIFKEMLNFKTNFKRISNLFKAKDPQMVEEISR